MLKADFMATGFSGSFEMWPPDQLTIAAVTKRLGGDESWLKVISTRDERYEELHSIFEHTQEKVIDAFREGDLATYVHHIATGLFYLIPAALWDGFEAVGYLAGRLYRGVMDDDYHRSIPQQFIDTPIMVHGDDATAWLKSPAVAALPLELPKPIPGAKLDQWFTALGDSRKALKNSELVQAARDKFPDYHVARDRVLDLRKKEDGHRRAGRPINGE